MTRAIKPKLREQMNKGHGFHFGPSEARHVTRAAPSIRCFVYNQTNQTLPAGGTLAVAFENKQIDTTSCWDISDPTKIFYKKKTGKFIVGFVISITAPSDGTLIAHIRDTGGYPNIGLNYDFLNLFDGQFWVAHLEKLWVSFDLMAGDQYFELYLQSGFSSDATISDGHLWIIEV